jgi:hypothetical protein
MCVHTVLFYLFCMCDFCLSCTLFIIFNFNIHLIMFLETSVMILIMDCHRTVFLQDGYLEVKLQDCKIMWIPDNTSMSRYHFSISLPIMIVSIFLFLPMRITYIHTHTYILVRICKALVTTVPFLLYFTQEKLYQQIWLTWNHLCALIPEVTDTLKLNLEKQSMLGILSKAKFWETTYKEMEVPKL